MANIMGVRWQYIKLLGHWIADDIAISISPKAPVFAAEQGASGEAAEDLENVILCEASQRIHLVAGLLYFEEPAIISVQ